MTPSRARTNFTPDVTPPAVAASPIFGTGEMAALTRSFHWEQTPLGPPELWPPSLLITVNTLLAARQPMFLWWGDHFIQFYNDAYRTFIGADRHPCALGQAGGDCWPEVWAQIHPRIETTFIDGVSHWFEDQLLPIVRDGPLVDVYWTYSYSPVRDEFGRIQGLLVVCADTTARVLAERRLHSEREQLAVIFEQAPAFFAVLDGPDFVFSLTNRRYQELIGSRDVLGKPVREAVPEAAGQGFIDLLQNVYQTGIPFVGRATPILLASGPGGPLDQHYLDFVYEPRREPDGSISGIIVLGIDVTERKRTEQALRDSEERLRLALAASRGMGTFDWHVQTDRTFADANYSRIAGLDPQLGIAGSPIRHYMEQMHPDDRPHVEAAIQETVRTGRDYAIDYRFLWPDGTIRWVSAYGSCTFDEAGAPLRFPGVILDITDRKLAERALIQTEKLAAVGRLASSIAHEINNPLESVTNLLYLARSTADIDQLRDYLATAEQELGRAAAITSQTLRFHRQSTRPVSISCDDLIGGTLDIFRSRILNAKLSVENRKRAHQPVLCFEGEIRQVLSNLVTNAIDAMQPTGGRLLLRSREAQDGRGRAGIAITVADTGPGIPPETLTHIFEPFYTTKGVGGTGLGLWVSKEIADRHQGRLSVSSSQSPAHHGTVFTLFLPFDAIHR